MATVKLLLASMCLLALGACTVTPPQIHSIIVNDQVVGESGTDVQLLRAGAPIALTPGTALEPGDEIITGPGAQAVLLLENGRIEVIVFENSEVRYSSVFLSLGEIFVWVRKNAPGWGGVDSEYIAAQNEETGYFVRVGENNEYSCEVLEGRVTVTSKSGSWQPVTISARDKITASGRSGTSRSKLSKPEYNRLVDRVNRVERIYRPTATSLMVPDVVAETETDAQKILRAHGFGRGTIVGVVTKKQRIGEVAGQSPLAGTRIKPGSAVTLEVEVAPTSVPNVVGSNLQSARRKLEGAKLAVGNIRDQLEVGVESGIVRTQSEPANKKVAPGTKVDLVVTEKGTKVPSLTGLSARAAGSALSNSGLKLGDQTTRASTAKANTIIEQDPDAGDIVRINSDVDVVLAIKAVTYCTVPNVSGQTPAEASRRIKTAGFAVDSNGSGSYVWGQTPTNPAAGTRLPCGDTVTVNLVIG